VAVNCCVKPAVMFALEGVTDIDASVTFAVTLSDAFPPMPLSEADTVEEPAATPVVRPFEFIDATAGVATVQLAVELKLAVEPLL